MNLFVCTARLGKDAEVRYTQSGTAVLSFAGAVDTGYGNNKKTVWVGFSVFGKRAEGELVNYLTKGSQVAVTGELNIDEWEKDGQKNFMLKCIVRDLDLIGGKQEAKKSEPKKSEPKQQQVVEDDFEDDIPF